MKLHEVLCTTDKAEATCPGGTVLINLLAIRDHLEVADERFACWIEVRKGEVRTHDLLFGTIAEHELLVAEQGIDVDALNWQTSEREVDVQHCTCPYCARFLLDHHLFPDGYSWYRKAWLQFVWKAEEWGGYLRWWFWYRWLKWWLLNRWSHLRQIISVLKQEVTR